MVSLLLHPAFSVRFAQRPSLDGELCSQKLFGSAEVLLGADPPALPRASPPLALTLSFIKATCSHTGVFSQTHSISQGGNRMLNKKVPVRNGNIMRLPRSKPQDRAAHVGSPAAESSLSSSPQQQACFFPLLHAASPGAFSALGTSGAFTTASPCSLFPIPTKSLLAGRSSLLNAEGATTSQRRREHSLPPSPLHRPLGLPGHSLGIGPCPKPLL